MIVIYSNLIMLWLYDKNMLMMMIINNMILFKDNLDRWGDKLSSEFEYYLRMF
jgi:hypothetical protein